MAPKIAILYYSTWGHIAALARAEAEGIKQAGGTCDIFQIQETLPQDVLTKMHAAPKEEDHPVLTDVTTILNYDAFLFGVPTRYGNFPAQWRTFWDRTGKIWQEQSLHGKFAGLFISTGTIGGGQESTAVAAMSTLAHQGLVYVPLGYKGAQDIFNNVDEVRGGSPWGAGTFSASNGSRKVSETELRLATIQGKSFYEIVARSFVK